MQIGKRKRATPDEYQSSDVTPLCLTHRSAKTDTVAIFLYTLALYHVLDGLAILHILRSLLCYRHKM